MRQTIKGAALRVAPRAVQWFLSRRQRLFIDRVTARAGLPRVAAMVAAHYDGLVAAGLFAGMRYVGVASGSMTAPKILGSYEVEVSPWLEGLCGSALDRIIDVGCAEGYYAVGMAMRCPAAQVVAFDIDAVARERCAELARVNGVADRVTVRGTCSPRVLSDAIRGNTLVICDTEGYEAELLDPAECPGLARATILVELHEFAKPGVTELLRRRFAPTHGWDEVPSGARDPAEFPTVAFLPQADQPLALTEMRPVQAWALMTPR